MPDVMYCSVMIDVDLAHSKLTKLFCYDTNKSSNIMKNKKAELVFSMQYVVNTGDPFMQLFFLYNIAT